MAAMQAKGCELLVNCTAEEWVRLQHFDDFSGSKKKQTKNQKPVMLSFTFHMST